MHPSSSLSSSRLRSFSQFLCFITAFITLSSAQGTFQGCYTIDSNLVLNDTSVYQSTGRCLGEICGPKNYSVYGLTAGQQCWCGNSIPAHQVSTNNCNLPCPGYPSDNCGASGYINVWLTGLGIIKGNVATTILSVASSTATAAPSNTVYITTAQATITAVPSQTGNSSNGGVSGGATAGIVIAVLLIVGGAAGAFFFIRRRRRHAYQKQWEGSNFGSSPGSLSRPFGTDQRLEPGMVQKRESVGSLADEQDYSRKILRVINPDGI